MSLDRSALANHAGGMRSTSFHEESESTVVAHARSFARAEFVQVTLAAHGIAATLQASSIYPSVDFVEGRGISVRMEDAAKAQQIVADLGLGDDPPDSEM